MPEVGPVLAKASRTYFAWWPQFEVILFSPNLPRRNLTVCIDRYRPVSTSIDPAYRRHHRRR